jgi:tRNA dimethylallyltransferase
VVGLFERKATKLFWMELIVLLGPTATGKSDIAVELAEQLGDAVIVSCDSRQVYKGLNLGTGKVEGRWEPTTAGLARYSGLGTSVYVYKSIVHCLIDYVDPRGQYSVSRYYQDWIRLLDQITQLEHPPKHLILTGGTGYYADAILQGKEYITAGYNTSALLDYQLRGQYYSSVLSRDTRILNQSDLYNRRRLLSYATGTVILHGLDVRVRLAGVFATACNTDNYKTQIQTRLDIRLESGMYEEFLDLYGNYGEVVANLGLEYKMLQALMLGWCSEAECNDRIVLETLHYSKRQRTWLNKYVKATVIRSAPQILDCVI